ncbi:MAG: hypothetical protein JXA78_11955 [Anaerolineales bacterium]|nr:hypothetical protein [Anaerolineales bacterium]
MRRATFLASLLLLAAIALAAWQALRSPQPMPLTPSLTGQEEYCLTCHADLPEISPAHPVQAFGCVICHGGERLALDADLAHSTLRGGRNPSDFSVVQESCGGADCHAGEAHKERDHIPRALSSIQATYAGAIANLRYTFGAQPDLQARMGIYAVEDPHPTPDSLPRLAAFDPAQETHPAIIAFSQNCLTCHLTAEALPGPEYARLSGCAACHTPTARTDLHQPLHRLTTSIAYTQCNTCHNRGNYDLRLMQFRPRDDQPTNRLQDYYQPIAQFTRCEWTLDCVDCHTRQEAMGDGHIYSSQKEVEYVRCYTCHGTLNEPPLTRTLSDPEDLALRLAFINPQFDLQVGDAILVTERGEPLWNTRRLPDGSFELFGKATGQRFTFRPVMGSACEQEVDQQESRYCHACHAVER